MKNCLSSQVCSCLHFFFLLYVSPFLNFFPRPQPPYTHFNWIRQPSYFVLGLLHPVPLLNFLLNSYTAAELLVWRTTLFIGLFRMVALFGNIAKSKPKKKKIIAERICSKTEILVPSLNFISMLFLRGDSLHIIPISLSSVKHMPILSLAFWILCIFSRHMLFNFVKTIVLNVYKQA